MVSDRGLREAFVDLADTLVRGYDAYEFLSKLVDYCIELLGVQAGGVLLADRNGKVGVAAASPADGVRALKLFEMQADEGPCVDAYRDGRQIVVEDLDTAGQRWPRFAPRALEEGFSAVVACPLRVREDTIGALNLFRAEAGRFDPDDVATAQALADVAAIGVLQERAVTDAQQRAGQLQHALDSRVVIEQAKGMLAHQLGVDMGQAFGALRRYARERNVILRHVAEALAEGKLDPGDIHTADWPGQTPAH